LPAFFLVASQLENESRKLQFYKYFISSTTRIKHSFFGKAILEDTNSNKSFLKKYGTPSKKDV